MSSTEHEKLSLALSPLYWKVELLVFRARSHYFRSHLCTQCKWKENNLEWAWASINQPLCVLTTKRNGSDENDTHTLFHLNIQAKNKHSWKSFSGSLVDNWPDVRAGVYYSPSCGTELNLLRLRLWWSRDSGLHYGKLRGTRRTFNLAAKMSWGFGPFCPAWHVPHLFIPMNGHWSHQGY